MKISSILTHLSFRKRRLLLGIFFVAQLSSNLWAKEFNVTLIYTAGGGGHIAAMAAFEEALKTYPIKPEGIKINFHRVDPPMSTLAGRLATEYWDTCFEKAYYDLLAPGLFSKCLVENSILPTIAAIDRFSRFGDLRKLAHADFISMESLIMSRGRPDMILSMINTGNAQFLAVAQKHNIPFRIGVTDYKINSFIDGIGHYGNKYTREQLEVYVPSDAEEVTEKLKKGNIPYVVTGYPVNPMLNKMAKDLREKDPETMTAIRDLLNNYHVDSGDSVIFVMMGAKGFDMNATIKYIETIKNNAMWLHNSGKKLQLFLAAGLNEELRDCGKKLALDNNDDFVLHPLDNLNVNQVASFMGIYQVGNPFLMFTKPGGSTVGQAEAMGTPTLYSLNPIEHERFNAALMKKKNYADTIDMAHRAYTLHPQKIVELGANGIERQVRYVSEAANQMVKQAPVIQAVHSLWPIQEVQNAFNQVSQDFNQMVAPTVNSIGNFTLSNLPQAITNQDIVDEITLIQTLRKYLVEGQRLISPPPNRFAEIIAPIIYWDLENK
jgi:UDP-N-acetylglucosamine:LPS N-acetylglucosamine transferase